MIVQLFKLDADGLNLVYTKNPLKSAGFSLILVT